MPDPHLRSLALNQINGDVIWSAVQGQLKKGNTPATVNVQVLILKEDHGIETVMTIYHRQKSIPAH